MAITAAQVKELRQSTGVGMMDCKKALQENGGDMQKAIVWLREKGMARAAKKAGRTAAEGVVVFAVNPTQTEAAIVELNCETDFAGKNEDFREFADTVSKLALEKKTPNATALLECQLNGKSVADSLTDLIAKVGENMNLRRVEFIECPEGMIVGYSHMGGKIGSLVALSGENNDGVKTLGADIAMHIAAAAPRYFDRSQVSTAELEQEKEIARKKLAEEGKPADMIEKIVSGQMNKFYKEVCLVDQAFVKEPKLSVTQHVKNTNSNVSLKAFKRFQLGEGIEKKEENFAEEVAAAAAQASK